MTLTDTERRRVKQAVETLARYNKEPYITDFVRQQPKPRIAPNRYEKDVLCEIIEQILLGEYPGKRKYVLKLNDLITYLDRLQETGRQHLYLFRLPEKGRDELLTRLRDVDEVNKLLGGEEEIWNDGRLIWETKNGPELALVRHHTNDGASQPQYLFLKWIQTRTYWVTKQPTNSSGSGDPSDEESTEPEAEVMDETEDEEKDQKVQIRLRRQERAATYFVIDLQNGDCELRIQALQGQARTARSEQLNVYRSLLAKLLGVELVGPTVLAPSIRRALIAREVDIVRCSAILPEGGRFIGGEGEFPPVDIRMLEAGLVMSFDWPQPKGGIGRIELDGRLDEILISRPLIPEQYRLVLERVQCWRREGLADITAAIQSKSVEVNAGNTGNSGNMGHTNVASPTQPSTKDAWMAVGILAATLKGGIKPDTPSVEPGIDRIIREYLRTHLLVEPDATGSPEGNASNIRAVAAEDGRPLDQFLGYIKEYAQIEHSNYQREIKLVHRQEVWNFRLSLFAAMLALIIVATGAGLLLFYPAKLLGTVTSLMGILSGHGTVLIRSYAKSLKAKRELIQHQQRDSNETILAIHTTLAIPDAKARTREMSRVTSLLLKRVTAPVPAEQAADK